MIFNSTILCECVDCTPQEPNTLKSLSLTTLINVLRLLLLAVTRFAGRHTVRVPRMLRVRTGG